MKPCISIVMPSFNQCKFIGEAIESILSQSVKNPIELVIMDGCSTDGTLKLLDKIKRSYPNTLFYYSERDSGPANAVNKAILKTRGDIVGWLNADDVYMPGTLSTVYKAFSDNPDWKVLYGHGQHINEEGDPLDYYPTKEPYTNIKEFANGCFICQPTVFFKRDLIEKAGQMDESLKTAFDYDWWIRIFSDFQKSIGFINQLVACSRLHQNNITFGQRERVIKESMQVIYKYFDNAPIHWFTSYANEKIAQITNEDEVKAIYDQLFRLSSEISPFLSMKEKYKLNKMLTDGSYSMTNLKSSLEKPHFSVLTSWLKKWIVILTMTSKQRRHYKLIKSSVHFDENWYRCTYKEVERSRMDPVIHYVLFGSKEGRKPASDFDVYRYLSEHNDLTRNQTDPFIHFIQNSN